MTFTTIGDPDVIGKTPMAREEHAVALKLPTFWTSQPEVWFVQAEAQFQLRGIAADSTKYYHVLAVLDQETATRLLDLVSRPPSENKYEQLKARLLETFGRRERAFVYFIFANWEIQSHQH